MENTYKNPFTVPVVEHTGDPFVMRFNGSFYLYCSAARDRFLYCWKSDDMVSWECLGKVFDENEFPEIMGGYAPEVIYCNGKFYLCTSPNGNGHFLMRADKPEGPFKRITGRFGQRIDGSFFLDDDGKWYFLRAEGGGIRIHSVKLTDDGAEVQLPGKCIPESNLGGWTEGPMILKRHGKYFLTYTGNHLLSLGYRVDYSVSEKSPFEGYVNMDNRIVLLSVDPEFHGLGHSSSCVGPDMDGAYIIYHSYDLLTEPRVRWVNVDRLFFNGARMYANTIWWNEEKPIKADYSVRGKEALIVNDGCYLTKEMTPDVYTCEVCFDPCGKDAEMLYANGNGRIRIADGFFTVYENGEEKAKCAVPENTSLNALICMRVSHKNCGCTKLEINNNQQILSWKSSLKGGKIGVKCEGEVGYVGFSRFAYGSSDKSAPKGIPGRFDAVHAREDNKSVEVKENTMSIFDVKVENEAVFTYPVNVKCDGDYGFNLCVNSYTGNLKASVSDGENETLLEGRFDSLDHNGFSKARFGKVFLKGGMYYLTIKVFGNCTVDSFEFDKYGEETKTTDVIENGECLSHGNILGWKGRGSMITKECGYSCSEFDGQEYFGDWGWKDYRIDATYVVDDEPTGEDILLFRVRRECYFGSQVHNACVGYSFGIRKGEMKLGEWNYGYKELVKLPIEYTGRTKIPVSITVKDQHVSVSVNGKQTMEYDIPMGNVTGKVGMNILGECFGIENMKITKI